MFSWLIVVGKLLTRCGMSTVSLVLIADMSKDNPLICIVKTLAFHISMQMLPDAYPMCTDDML